MQWRPVQLDPLSRVDSLDDDTAERLWHASRAAALTDPVVAAPVRLVQQVQAVAAWLDAHGADLSQRTTSDGLGLLTERARRLGLGRSSRTSCGGKTRLVRASDGWVAVALTRPDAAELVPAWLEHGVDGDPWTTIERVASSTPAAVLRDRAALAVWPARSWANAQWTVSPCSPPSSVTPRRVR